MERACLLSSLPSEEQNETVCSDSSYKVSSGSLTGILESTSNLRSSHFQPHLGGFLSYLNCLLKILLSLRLMKMWFSIIKSNLHATLAHISNVRALRASAKQTRDFCRSFQGEKQSEELQHKYRETT